MLVTLLLARQRQPPMAGSDSAATTAAWLGAAVVSLPSGLLALISEAVAKLESQLVSDASA